MQIAMCRRHNKLVSAAIDGDHFVYYMSVVYGRRIGVSGRRVDTRPHTQLAFGRHG
jgi:hypothetical protein